MGLGRWLKGLFAPRQHALRDLPDLLRDTVRTLSVRFSQQSIDHAIIGGIAVALHGEPRFTQDVDFMIKVEDAERAHAMMVAAGFEALQRTDHFGNYRIGLLHVDFLFAKGPQMRAMLADAVSVNTDVGLMKLALPADIVGLKLQALANDPARENDSADIRRLIVRFHKTMDLQRLRSYFMLFEKVDELERLLESARQKNP